MSSSGPSDHIRSNRAYWDSQAVDYVESGRRGWANNQPRWGIYGVPEENVGLFESFQGGDVIELGCGTAYVSAWLARRGGRAIGIDNSHAQLATASGFQDEFNLRFPLVHGDAERLPFNDESFDFAISEYGAAIWCDPYRWLPEAARVLRPGGRLVFLGNSVLIMHCVSDDDEIPAGNQLLRPQFGMRRFEWPDDPGVEFHISHGENIRLLRSYGFEVENLIEIEPPLDADETRYPFVNLDWARRWPAEEAWIVRKEG
ncbi:MAG: class I SAM-dependent methyltransferase [Actinomycetota bacterium]|nr:class I SAM-dependent methyltransferase [Actinomycetota bacterium]